MLTKQAAWEYLRWTGARNMDKQAEKQPAGPATVQRKAEPQASRTARLGTQMLPKDKGMRAWDWHTDKIESAFRKGMMERNPAHYIKKTLGDPPGHTPPKLRYMAVPPTKADFKGRRSGPAYISKNLPYPRSGPRMTQKQVIEAAALINPRSGIQPILVSTKDQRLVDLARRNNNRLPDDWRTRRPQHDPGARSTPDEIMIRQGAEARKRRYRAWPYPLRFNSARQNTVDVRAPAGIAWGRQMMPMRGYSGYTGN